METTVRRSEIADRVRTAARQANVNGFISDTELNRLITEGAYELYDLLIAARGAEYYSTVYGFATEADVSDYDLPDDFYQLHAIALNDTAPTVVTVDSRAVTTYPTSGWREPPRFRPSDLWTKLNSRGDAVAHLAYSTTGQQADYAATVPQARIRFYPTPTKVFSVKIVYLPVCMHVVQVSPTDVYYDGINGWDTFVVAHCVAELAAMQERDPSFYLSKKAEQAARIAKLAGDRDEAQPAHIANRRRDATDLLSRQRRQGTFDGDGAEEWWPWPV